MLHRVHSNLGRLLSFSFFNIVLIPTVSCSTLGCCDKKIPHSRIPPCRRKLESHTQGPKLKKEKEHSSVSYVSGKLLNDVRVIHHIYKPNISYLILSYGGSFIKGV